MVRLQEVELDFGHTEDGGRKTELGWTDRRGSRNSYLDWLIVKGIGIKEALRFITEYLKVITGEENKEKGKKS